MASRARFYPRPRLARPADERRSMVTTHSAHRLSAPSFAIEMIVRFCALVVFPVWRAARLAARLALPPRFRRPLGASTDCGSSAWYGADTAISDRTRPRSLWV